MKSYARIQDGVVMEVIPPMTYDADSPVGVEPPWKAGDEIPIDRRYTPELVATMVDITGISPQPQQWWTYDGAKFSPPSE
jgi:hypothetical protein